ncbi:MAG TPA: ABC transporter permease [Opitutaceae bacterium]|nr:ABC transporter permease [Opitutaceae bacterium]
MLHGLAADGRFAVRMLAKHRGFTVTALLTLALCIGANTAIFSLLYALVIKPLPFSEAGRIVEVYNSFPKVGLNKLPSNVVQYLDFKEHTNAFAQLALWQGWECTLGEEAGPVRTSGAMATAELFDVLGVRPLLGSFFTLENCRPGADHVIVLTQSFWESNFQEDPGVLGRSVRLDGESYTILGIVPRVFEAFDARVRFIRPLSWTANQASPNARYGVTPHLYGRLKPGATVAQALAQVAALEKDFYEKAPAQFRGFLDRSGHEIGVATVQTQRVDPVKSTLFMLQGGVLFVLLIGCVDVANLLLARSNARQAELAVRVALGAGRKVIARQLFVESLLLTLSGTVLGLGVAWAAIRGINRFTAQLLPHTLPFALDGRILGVTALAAVGLALLIGLLPVIHVLSSNLHGRLQTQSRGASTGRGVRALSGILVAVQVAFALMLLTGAGLLIHSFARALAVAPGLDPRQVIVARIAFTGDYRNGDRIARFEERLLAALREIPGFAAVSLASATPFQGGLPINAFTLRDYTLAAGAPQPGAFHLGASPEYLQALHIPLREGRWFEPNDTAQSRQVLVVDEDFARRYFPSGSAVGQHLTFGAPPQRVEDWPEIVGVVGNVRHLGVEEHSGNPFLYHPLTQFPAGAISVLVRTPRPAAEVIALLRDKLRTLDPALPLFDASPLESAVGASFDRRRAVMLLLGSFAGLALLLAAVGIYGVLAYDVSQRTREIGIRGAIGASRGQIVGLVLRQGLWKAGLGVVCGLAGAFGLSRFMTSLLFDLKPTDPVAYIAVSLLLLGVALLASYLPARRAAKIDPLVALRVE